MEEVASSVACAYNLKSQAVKWTLKDQQKVWGGKIHRSWVSRPHTRDSGLNADFEYH